MYLIQIVLHLATACFHLDYQTNHHFVAVGLLNRRGLHLVETAQIMNSYWMAWLSNWLLHGIMKALKLSEEAFYLDRL